MSKEEESLRYKTASYNDKRIVQKNAYLMEAIIRHRIQDSVFYKQHLYLTNEATILHVIKDEVHYVGGVDANGRPAPFLCCLLRLLELEPSREYVEIYLSQLGYNEFKYMTALAMLYARLSWEAEEVYTLLESFLTDYRKLRMRLKTPRFNDQKIPVNYHLSYIDEWADELLTKERMVDIILPRLPPRHLLLERGSLEPRKYHIDDNNEDDANSSSDNDDSAQLEPGESSYESDSE